MSKLRNSKWLFAATTLAVSFGFISGASATVPAAVKLVLTTPAPAAVSGTAFTTKPVVTIQDASGNTVTSNTSAVTVAITGGSGGTLLGTTTKNAVAGVVTFDALGIRGTAGTVYTLTYSDGGLTAATQTVAITGRPFRLATTTHAAGAVSGAAFTTQPVVTVQDAQGNTSIADSGAVSVTITGGKGATLIGTITATVVSGVATFSGLGINGTAGTVYVLTYSDGVLVTATQIIALPVSVETPIATPVAATVATPGAVSGNASGKTHGNQGTKNKKGTKK